MDASIVHLLHQQRRTRHRHRPEEIPSDCLLLQRYTQKKDHAAFEELVRRYSGLVLSTARRIVGHHQTAEDVLQATFLVLSRKAANIKWKETIAPWLYATAYRLACQARRCQPRQAVKATEPHSLPDESLHWAETCQVLDGELMRLSETTRAALILCYLEGKTRDEAAEMLGLTLATLKRRLEQGRRLLRDRLTQRGIAFSTAGWGLLLTRTDVQAASVRAIMQAVLMNSPSASVALLVPASLTIWWVTTLVAIIGLSAVGATCWLMLPQPLVPETAVPAHPVIQLRPLDGPKVDVLGDPLPPEALTRFGSIRFRPGQMMVKMAYSPDQKYLATWLKGYLSNQGSDRLVYWDAATGKEVQSLEMPKNDLLTMRWLPDGQLMALTRFAWRSYHLCLFTPGKETTYPDEDGNSLNTSGTGDIRCAAISPHGKWIATGRISMQGDAQPIELWEARPNKPLSDQQPVLLGSYAGHTLYVQFSNDGKRLIALCRKQGSPIDVPSQGRVIGQPASQLMEGDWEEKTTIQVFDVASRQKLSSFQVVTPFAYLSNKAPPDQIALSHDGSVLYLGDSKGSVLGYDTITGKESFVWKLEQDSPSQKRQTPTGISRLILSNDGTTIYASMGTSVQTWDVPRKQPGKACPILEYTGHLAITSDGKRLTAASSTINTQIDTCETDTGKSLLHYPGHENYITDVALLPHGQMVTASFDKNLITWDIRSGKELNRKNISTTNGLIAAMKFSQDAKGLFGYLASQPQMAYLPLDGTTIPCSPVNKDRNYFRFSQCAGNGLFYRHTTDMKLHYWDATTRSLKHSYSITLPEFSIPGINFALYTPDQSRLLILSSGTIAGEQGMQYRCGAISLHDAQTGQLQKHWFTPLHELKGAQFISDGKQLLVYGRAMDKQFAPKTPDEKTLQLPEQNVLALLDVSTGKVIQSYEAPHSKSWHPVIATFNSHEGSMAVAYADASIALYDVAVEKPRKVLTGHRGEISALRFLPGDQQLLSASHDGTCLMWDAKARK